MAIESPACAGHDPPSGDPRAVFARSLERPWTWHAAALLILMAVLTVRWAEGVLDPSPRPDERAYVDAFAKVLEGESPYDLHYYLYPPPFAYGGALLTYLLGPSVVLALIRLADVFGAALLVWIAFGFLDLSWRARVLGGVAICSLTPGMYVAMVWGNITPAVGAAMVTGLLAWRRRPIASGLLLGLAGVVKPLTPVALVALGAHRPAKSPAHGGTAGRTHLLAAGVGLVTGLLLALLTPGLGRYLAISEGRPGALRSVALHKLVWSLGLEISSLWVVAFVALLAVLWVRLEPLGHLQIFAVSTATAVLAVPLVWAHTLLVTLPLQGIALETALDRTRDRARLWSEGRRGAVYELALVALGCLALLYSDAADGLHPRYVVLRSTYVALTIATPVALAAYVVVRLRDVPRSAT